MAKMNASEKFLIDIEAISKYSERSLWSFHDGAFMHWL